MSGPKEFRETMYGRVPTLKEYREYLQYKLSELDGMDCGCDLDFAQGRLQEYVNSWPQIFNEQGGI
jgi:hypothetical protein